MKEWFIEHYAEMRYWEAVGAAILSVPLLIYWLVEKYHNKRRKK